MDHFEFERVTAGMSPQERSQVFNNLSKRKQRKLMKSTTRFYKFLGGAP